MNKASARSALFSVIIAVATATGAHGAADNDDEPPKPTETTMECEDGKIWDKDKKECVEANSSHFDDDDLFDAARETAYAGQYDRAMHFLTLASNQNDPRMLNYMGFVLRKKGDTVRALDFYKAALAIDPDYNLARSYMGQGMAADGDVNGARKQLAEIWARGGRDSWAYASLNRALTGADTDY